MLMICWCNWCR